MTQEKHPPFRSKAQREQEQNLQAKYGELGNPELLAAILQKKKGEKPERPQMQAEMTATERD